MRRAAETDADDKLWRGRVERRELELECVPAILRHQYCVLEHIIRMNDEV